MVVNKDNSSHVQLRFFSRLLYRWFDLYFVILSPLTFKSEFHSSCFFYSSYHQLFLMFLGAINNEVPKHECYFTPIKVLDTKKPKKCQSFCCTYTNTYKHIYIVQWIMARRPGIVRVNNWQTFSKWTNFLIIRVLLSLPWKNLRLLNFNIFAATELFWDPF